jgi:hypothetical protein
VLVGREGQGDEEARVLVGGAHDLFAFETQQVMMQR